MSQEKLSRRRFLKVAAATGAALFLGKEKVVGKISQVVLDDKEETKRLLHLQKLMPTPTPTAEPIPTPTPEPTPTPTPQPEAGPPPAETPTATATPEPNCQTTRVLEKVERPNWSYEELLKPIGTGPQNKPYVALTFDDGWGHGGEIRQILFEKQVLSTFFFYGKAAQDNAELVKNLIADGHEIGNHTENHANLFKLDEATIFAEIENCELILEEFGTTAKPYFRPPWLSYDLRVLKIAADMGFRTILKTVGLPNWKQASPGAIILLHTQDATYKVLPDIIDTLRCRGLEPVTLSKLFAT